MTDRYHSFVVTLESDLRSDDADATLTALRQIKGVIDVRPQTSDAGSLMAQARAESSLRSVIFDALMPHIQRRG